MIYELITNRSDVNLDDLSGTELEAAETALFKEAIAEAIRVTMWCGDTSRESGFNSFDGFLQADQSRHRHRRGRREIYRDVRRWRPRTLPKRC